MTVVYVAWLAASFTLFLLFARDRIVEALARRGGCDQSWCVCEIDCETVR